MTKTQISFADAVAAVTPEQVADATANIQANFLTRATYEHDQDTGNSNIQKTLGKIQRGMSTEGVVRALVVSGVGEGFINTQEVKHKRRNVYALDKTRDILYGASTGHLKNAINIAVLASMKALNGKLPFTGLVAKACASDKVGVDNALKALLTRHTVSESTASTQASSTMTALEDLGVVKNTGTRTHPVYVMQETPLAERLMAIV